MKVTIKKEADIYELAEILVKLRYYEDRYDDRPTYDNRDRVRLWRAKADCWINQNVKEG